MSFQANLDSSSPNILFNTISPTMTFADRRREQEVLQYILHSAWSESQGMSTVAPNYHTGPQLRLGDEIFGGENFSGNTVCGHREQEVKAKYILRGILGAEILRPHALPVTNHNQCPTQNQ